MLGKLKYHPFFIRLLNWEYWPIYISNIPVFFFWMIHAIRARDLFFFAAVNPAIATGGFFGEEKHKIYALIPQEYLPKTLFIPAGTSRTNEMIIRVNEAGMTYPLVCKPDVGERGMNVKVIDTPEDLIQHAKKMEGGIIIQEYISYPTELSVMCHRFPHSNRKAVTSICKKAFLTVTGDGESTVGQLIQKNPRAILQKQTLARRIDLKQIPKNGETLLLEPIGNHCRGTQFLNTNHWISPQLEETILNVLSQMPGIYYGRFDLRTASIEELSAGREFLIMEFNGAGSEPAHIYDPGYSVFQAYRDIWNHWKIMYHISKEQKASGIRTMHWREGLGLLRAYFTYKKKASLTYGL